MSFSLFQHQAAISLNHRTGAERERGERAGEGGGGGARGGIETVRKKQKKKRETPQRKRETYSPHLSSPPLPPSNPRPAYKQTHTLPPPPSTHKHTVFLLTPVLSRAAGKGPRCGWVRGGGVGGRQIET